ncbi:dienelactone hydrolase family protein [Halotalea alkalilenta]|uniref:dienelactone hydrolase family protein n=1 Tax=Halotalea alkalilenta TaxID=376489 RepID=UPI00048938AE|nr:dienelactone hydrolase family protein [Halotalea alkalilenta]
MNSETVTLTARDGVTLSAYVARPDGAPKGALVVVQEIFGVNSHIRSVADGFAAEGYLAVAPALFDRIEPGVELGYEGEDMVRARELLGKLRIDASLADTQAAIDYAAAESATKVGVVGYCFGGSIAWLAASRLSGVAAAVGYYGGRIPDDVDELPRVPVLLHFGEFDDHIPLQGVEEVAKRHPEVAVRIYPAGHGFNCDQRASFDAPSAALAKQRTLEFFARELG